MASNADKLYDKRILERNIRKGMLTRKDHERYLKELEDAKPKCVALFSEEEEAFKAEEASGA